ncbi:hypothetical protein FS749_003143 [Ceratobasidium sp. UAMH 11750]|nr:hypothetical protein FS749_003143 [Ceratobasidium sp. UAMH 11750]
MSTLSASSSSATNTSFASTQTPADQKRCYYCPRVFSSSLERCQHIVDTPACKAAREVVILKAMKRERAERQQQAAAKSNGAAQPGSLDAADPQASASKRRKVAEETVPGGDLPASAEKSNPLSDGKWPRPTVETAPDQECHDPSQGRPIFSSTLRYFPSGTANHFLIT